MEFSEFFRGGGNPNALYHFFQSEFMSYACVYDTFLGLIYVSCMLMVNG